MPCPAKDIYSINTRALKLTCRKFYRGYLYNYLY